MQSAIISWLGIVIIVGAVVATLGADFFRQRESAAAPAGADGGAGSVTRQPGGRVFWFTVVAVVLAIIAVVATVVRLASLA